MLHWNVQFSPKCIIFPLKRTIFGFCLNFLHMTEFFSTRTAGDKYQVCISTAALKIGSISRWVYSHLAYYRELIIGSTWLIMGSSGSGWRQLAGPRFAFIRPLYCIHQPSSCIRWPSYCIHWPLCYIHWPSYCIHWLLYCIHWYFCCIRRPSAFILFQLFCLDTLDRISGALWGIHQLLTQASAQLTRSYHQELTRS